jgi:hypothetical protein
MLAIIFLKFYLISGGKKSLKKSRVNLYMSIDLHLRWDGQILKFINSSSQNPIIFFKTYVFHLYGLSENDLVFSSDLEGLEILPDFLTGGQAIVDESTPDKVFVRHQSLATAVNYLEISRDTTFKHGSKNLYLEESVAPVLVDEVNSDGSSDSYIKLEFVVNQADDQVFWVNDSASHSIMKFTGLPAVTNRIPSSLSNGWVTLKGNSDMLLVGQTVVARFNSNIESLDNQLFTSNMSSDPTTQPGYDDGIEQTIVTSEIDLGSMKSVDFVSKAPESGDILQFVNGMWVPKIDTILGDSDVFYDIDTIADNHVLAWKTSKFAQSATPIPDSLIDSTLANSGEIFVSDGSAWQNRVPDLNMNSDVSYDPDQISSGQILVWSSGKFEAISRELNGNIDVNFDKDAITNDKALVWKDGAFVESDLVFPAISYDSSVADGQYLVWSSEDNSFVPSAGPVPEVLTDGGTSVEGGVLTWDGQSWVSKIPELNDNSDVLYDQALISDGKCLVWSGDKFVPSDGVLPNIEIDQASLADGQVLVYSATNESWIPSTLAGTGIDYKLSKLEMLNDELVATVSGETDEIDRVLVAISMIDINLYNNGSEIYIEDSYPRTSELKIFRGTPYRFNLLGVWTNSLTFSETLDGIQYSQVQIESPTSVILSADDLTPSRLYFREDSGAQGGFIDILSSEEMTFFKSDLRLGLEEVQSTADLIARNPTGNDYIQYPDGYHDPSSGDDLVRTASGLWISSDLASSVLAPASATFLENSESFPAEDVFVANGSVPDVKRYFQTSGDTYYVPNSANWANYAHLKYTGSCVGYKGIVGNSNNTVSAKGTSSDYNAYWQSYPIIRKSNGVWHTLTSADGLGYTAETTKAILDDADDTYVWPPFILSTGQAYFEYLGRTWVHYGSNYDGVALVYYPDGYTGYSFLQLGQGSSYKWGNFSATPSKTWRSTDNQKFLINIYSSGKFYFSTVDTSFSIPTYSENAAHFAGGAYFSTTPPGKTGNVLRNYSSKTHPYEYATLYTWTTLGSGPLPSNYDSLDRYDHEWVLAGSVTRAYGSVSGNSVIVYKTSQFVEEVPGWVRLNKTSLTITENSTLTIQDNEEETPIDGGVGQQGQPDTMAYIAWIDLGSGQYPNIGNFRLNPVYNFNVRDGTYPTWVNTGGTHALIFWEEDQSVADRALLPILGTGWYVYNGQQDLVPGLNINARNPYDEAEIMQKLAMGADGEIWPVSSSISAEFAVLENIVKVSIAIDDLSDVTATGAAGDLLIFDGSLWKSTKIDIDLTFGSQTMTDGQILEWRSDVGKFVPSDAAIPPILVGGTTNLAEGEVLSWDGSAWQNRVPDLNMNSDVFYDPNQISAGQILVWTSGKFEAISRELNGNIDVNFDKDAITNDKVLVWKDGAFVESDLVFPAISYSSVADGQYLVWSSEDNSFVPSAGPVPEVLTGGTSVQGGVLTWDGQSWVSKIPELNDNSDVLYDQALISDGKCLVWSGDKFVPSDGVLPNIEIDQASLADGQVLVYSATSESWIPSTLVDHRLTKLEMLGGELIATVSGETEEELKVPLALKDLGDVGQDVPIASDVLIFDGTTWNPVSPQVNLTYDAGEMSAGQTLVWSDEFQKFVPSDRSLPPISSTDPKDKEILVFDADVAEWVPQTHHDCHLTKLRFNDGQLVATVSGCEVQGEIGLRIHHDLMTPDSLTVESSTYSYTDIRFLNEEVGFTLFYNTEIGYTNVRVNVPNLEIMFSDTADGNEFSLASPFSPYSTHIMLSMTNQFPDALYWRNRNDVLNGSGTIPIRNDDQLLFSPTLASYYLEELEPLLSIVGKDIYEIGYNTHYLSTNSNGQIVTSTTPSFSTFQDGYPWVENIIRSDAGVWYSTMHSRLDDWNKIANENYTPPAEAKQKNYIQEHLDGAVTLFPPAAIRAHFGRTPLARSDRGFFRDRTDIGGKGELYYFFYENDIYYCPDILIESESFLHVVDGITKINDSLIDSTLTMFQSATSARCLAWVEGGDSVSALSGWRRFEQDLPFDFRALTDFYQIRTNPDLYPFTAAATYLADLGKLDSYHYPRATPYGVIVYDYEELGSGDFPNKGTFRTDVKYRFAVRHGAEPTGQVEYPAWQNAERSVSFVYWDENASVANRDNLPLTGKFWYPLNLDVETLSDGHIIETRSAYYENFFMRKMKKGDSGELHPVASDTENPLVVYSDGQVIGDMIVSTTIKLANMEDVDFSSSPTPGQILTLNENGKWVAKTDTLSNNDDIDLTGGISANQVLAFDAVLEKWVPKDPVLVQDYYATSLEIDGNGLLTATITNEVDGDTKIVNTTINLNNLGDVSIPSNPSIGDILSYGATGFSPTANLIKNATDVFYETPREQRMSCVGSGERALHAEPGHSARIRRDIGPGESNFCFFGWKMDKSIFRFEFEF